MLKLLNGKPVLAHVYHRLKPLNDIARIIIATDDKRIRDLANELGTEVFMTSPDHKSGTDRCAEVAEDLNEEIIINVQGDEPFIDPQSIRDLIELFHQEIDVSIATLACVLQNKASIQDRNTVKLVRSVTNKAIYFSRSVIPSLSTSIHLKHIGVYAFKREILIELAKLPPSSLELAESLEQLRWLENDFAIHTIMTEMDGLSIDTEEDLKRAEMIMQKSSVL